MTDDWVIGQPDDTEQPDNEFDIIDRNRDKESGELLSFLVIEDGEPTPKKATPENVLLYEHGLKEFLSGNHAVIVSDDDPEVIIAQTGNDKSYIVKVNGSTVETTPSQAHDILQALEHVIEANNSHQREQGVQEIIDLYDDIMSSQVRRWLVRAMMQTFDEDEIERIDEHNRGWLVDDYYLIDWNASLYTIDDDPDSGGYSVSGSSVQQVDRSYEFLQLTPSESPEPVAVSVNGDEYRLTEREMLFLAKVRFMLDRRYYHPDKPFWLWNNKYAGIDDI